MVAVEQCKIDKIEFNVQANKRRMKKAVTRFPYKMYMRVEEDVFEVKEEVEGQKEREYSNRYFLYDASYIVWQLTLHELIELLVSSTILRFFSFLSFNFLYVIRANELGKIHIVQDVVGAQELFTTIDEIHWSI